MGSLLSLPTRHALTVGRADDQPPEESAPPPARTHAVPLMMAVMMRSMIENGDNDAAVAAHPFFPFPFSK